MIFVNITFFKCFIKCRFVGRSRPLKRTFAWNGKQCSFMYRFNDFFILHYSKHLVLHAQHQKTNYHFELISNANSDRQSYFNIYTLPYNDVS